jgi:hypothetical protein
LICFLDGYERNVWRTAVCLVIEEVFSPPYSRKIYWSESSSTGFQMPIPQMFLPLPCYSKLDVHQGLVRLAESPLRGLPVLYLQPTFSSFPFIFRSPFFRRLALSCLQLMASYSLVLCYSAEVCVGLFLAGCIFRIESVSNRL